MKKMLLRMIATFVFVTLILCSSFCVSAVTPSVTAAFEDNSCGFLPAGDLNANGKVAADDLTLLRRILLRTTKNLYTEVYSEMGSDAKFSDVNGDGKVNIIDLVRSKKCATKTFIETTVGKNGTGGMNVYGNVAYAGNLSNDLKADQYYQISFDYKSNTDLELTIKSVSNQVYSYKSVASSNWTTATYLVATAEKFISTSDIELQICGDGVVDNITITSCNVDNNLSDPW